MNDLFVWTADADAQAVMQQVLSRHQAMGIRAITFKVDRYSGRDSGMIKDGPELTRFQKNTFKRLVLLLDHHGSGREKESVETIHHQLSARLDRVTWQGNHLAVMAVPELEEWLWYSEDAMLKCLSISKEEMKDWNGAYAHKTGQSVEQLRKEQPKELFEHLVLRKKRRKPTLADFECIASSASLKQWQGSASFHAITERLQQWFPAG
ncbi:MAG: hypothetical protein H7837_00785 [Magnetococcus sp. MYC-9]